MLRELRGGTSARSHGEPLSYTNRGLREAGRGTASGHEASPAGEIVVSGTSHADSLSSLAVAAFSWRLGRGGRALAAWPLLLGRGGLDV